MTTRYNVGRWFANREYTVYICANSETLESGYFPGDGRDFSDECTEIVRAGVKVINDRNWSEQKHGSVFYDTASSFRDWHGGKHSGDQCGRVVTAGGRKTQFGYAAGLAVTHEENPPKWLCELCDRVTQAMSDKATELGLLASWRG